MKPYKTLWVVEMRMGVRSIKWEPTVGVALTREEGRRNLRNWVNRNVNDFFRLKPYQAVR